ncbi:GDSL esterase/lipase at1g29670 [Phtheirospermum japonicum]|uniref:GDSL esterase/lipase at1g29670 n=1 Tax=Phtheirospermum japonicum TaxID=374723 RepID=A0A830B9A1_9LAMI|nr:GDSL esterase/lipase at1g29670 [Phtheirospermum japonicum]
MFVFGSSIVDNGNNNFLANTRARVDYEPYGVDFPGGPSGRFTNSKNIVDILGERLKLRNFIPPFNDPSTNGTKILHGVNYASGGSGILDDTGAIAGNVISLNQQIRNFETVSLPDLKQQLGEKSTKIVSDEFLFVVGSGGNDYSFNYFVSLVYSNVTLEAFTANLTNTLSNQLKRLYNSGARKFVLMAINPNGCSPMATARVPMNNGCVESLNRAAQMFNVQLKSLVDDIRPQMPGSNLVFVNAYKVIIDILRFPRLRGFRNANSTCCEVTPISQGGTGVLCRRGGSVCPNRNEYVYFDGLHPTEAVNVVIANKAFASILRDEVYPFNVRKLSEI